MHVFITVKNGKVYSVNNHRDLTDVVNNEYTRITENWGTKNADIRYQLAIAFGYPGDYVHDGFSGVELWRLYSSERPATPEYIAEVAQDYAEKIAAFRQAIKAYIPKALPDGSYFYEF